MDNFIEVSILLAMLAEDDDKADELLSEMLPSELSSLRDVVRRMDRFISGELARKLDSHRQEN